MIFVTVGTTLTFDDLIKHIDLLKEQGKIKESVICQIGNGDYQPKHCEYFRFKPSVDEYLEQASLVICHGGTGSTLGVLSKGKKFVAVANPKGIDDHQALFLERISNVIPVIWTKDVESIEQKIHLAKKLEYSRVEIPSLVDDLTDFFNAL